MTCQTSSSGAVLPSRKSLSNCATGTFPCQCVGHIQTTQVGQINTPHQVSSYFHTHTYIYIYIYLKPIRILSCPWADLMWKQTMDLHKHTLLQDKAASGERSNATGPCFGNSASKCPTSLWLPSFNACQLKSKWAPIWPFRSPYRASFSMDGFCVFSFI